MEAEEYVFQLCHHNDKVAIALGINNIAPTNPLQIKKIWGFSKIATLPRRSPPKILRDERITLITFKMVFVNAWTIGFASNQSCQSLSSSFCFE
jgi:hypothetical protein